MASIEEPGDALANGELYSPVAVPPLLQVFTVDDAIWLLWAVLIVGPVLCGIALTFVWHPLLWKAIGLLLSLACALLFATHLAPRPAADLSGDIALITGGTTGLGLVLGKQLAARGVKVVTLSREIPDDLPADFKAYVCDVSDREAVRSVAKKLRKEVGDPTIVVNNAGVVNGKLLLDLTEVDIQRSFGANTLAQFWIVQEFLPALIRAGRGHIVNMSSVMGLIACAQMTDYTASKAAVVAFHASLRNELDYRYAAPGVRTTLVLPGHISTGMFEHTILPGSWWLRRITGSLSPEYVAQAIVRAIEGGKANTVLRLPFFTHSARLLGPTSALVPGPILRLSHWLSGGDWAMSKYGPHPDAGQRIAAERKAK